MIAEKAFGSDTLRVVYEERETTDHNVIYRFHHHSHVEIGESAMQFRFDEEANALYIAIRPREVVRTIQATNIVYIHVHSDGAPLRIEFVSADEFVPFLRRLHALEQSHEWRDIVHAKVRDLILVSPRRRTKSLVMLKS